MTSRRPPATLLAITAIFCVQFGNALARSYFAQAGPLGAAALRLFFSAIIVVLAVRPRVGGWDRRTWLGVLLLGIGLGGMNALIYLAIDRIPIGIAVTVELLGPLAVAAAGTRRPIDALWVLLALGGVVMLGVDPGQALSAAGLLLAGGAAVFWGLYILASSRLGPRVRGIDGIVVAMAVAALIVVPLGAADAWATADALRQAAQRVNEAETALDQASGHLGRIAWQPPASQWLTVVFLQDEDADRVLDLLDQDGPGAAIEHLRGFDYGEETTGAALANGHVYDEPPTSTADQRVNDGEYALVYSRTFGTVALYRQHTPHRDTPPPVAAPAEDVRRALEERRDRVRGDGSWFTPDRITEIKRNRGLGR